MHVYALHMFTERLQILVSKEQRLLLEREARRRNASVASIVRDAVEAELGGSSRAARLRAVAAISDLRGAPFLPPDELGREIEAARLEAAERGLPEDGAA
jgi:hypothetical protein